MASAATFFTAFLPHKLVKSALLRRTFMAFAHANGLVYIGLLLPSDDYEPVRGFTLNTDQVDNHVVHGSVHGRDVTILQRTVSHADTLHGKKLTHSHTWIVVAFKHEVPHSPRILLLSHDHPRLHEEAVAIHHSKSQHVALEYSIDAHFLAYAKPSAASDFKEVASSEFVRQLVAQPHYDYEIDKDILYLYSHATDPTEIELTHMLNVGIALTNEYEKSPA